MSLLLQTSLTPRPRLNINLVPRTTGAVKSLPFVVLSRKSDLEPDPKLNSAAKPKPKPRSRNRLRKTEASQDEDGGGGGGEDPNRKFPTTIPRKPRRGRKSEAAAVEDYVRDSLEQTFASIREQSSEVFENKGNVMKNREEDEDESKPGSESEISDDEEEDEEVAGEKKGKKKMVVEEESRDWPLDADVGWGIRASEYFEKHPIKNVVGEDGVEIDWEGEIEDNWVKEINCLEWESFAFHPSPLVVFVFERYNRLA